MNSSHHSNLPINHRWLRPSLFGIAQSIVRDSALALFEAAGL